jgi:hypothetical protein
MEDDRSRSITFHDYFIAATVLCTALFLDKSTSRSSLSISAGPSTDEMLRALERCVAIFAEVASESVEARRACRLLGVLLFEFQSSRDAAQTDECRSQRNFDRAGADQSFNTNGMITTVDSLTELSSSTTPPFGHEIDWPSTFDMDQAWVCNGMDFMGP